MRVFLPARRALCLLVTIWATACGGDESAVAGAIAARLEGQPMSGVPMNDWQATRAFYAQREDVPAWVNGKSPLDRASDALALLKSAPAHGLPVPAILPELDATIARLKAGEIGDKENRARELGEFDIRVTASLLTLGREVALGRTAPKALDIRWKHARTPPKFLDALAKAVDGDVDNWLDALQPQHVEYAELRDALVQLRKEREQGSWPVVPTKSLAPGQRGAAVAALRQRLMRSGQLSPARESDVYDDELKAAVQRFQDLHGFKATGIADETTVSAMNVPLDERIRQVSLNLERWRWLPDDLGGHHLWINIPHYTLIARENGRAVMDIRVVVGTAGAQATPVFSSQMSTVVFSPYWNIPDSIAEGETAPAAARDENYLARNDIEILRRSGPGTERVKASDVDWDDPEAIRQLAFRQRPGAGNALGHVKFLFPNPYSIYLHDTPADNLFSQRNRALSHGCIRVEEPETLAKYVLRGHREWDEARIVEAMRAGVEKPVALRQTLPVHIVYFTAWADEHGVHFRPDIYGFDARQR